MGFSMMWSEPYLYFSFRKKSSKRNFLFASLVKTSGVSLKRLIVSALPIRQVIRQKPVRMAPAELNPFLYPVGVFGCPEASGRQKGTRSEGSERVGGIIKEMSHLKKELEMHIDTILKGV